MNPAPVKRAVSIEVLEQLDIRAGTIRSVEEVPGSRKLVRLAVDFGDHARTVLSPGCSRTPDAGRLPRWLSWEKACGRHRPW